MVYWGVTTCSSVAARRFGGTYRYHLQVKNEGGKLHGVITQKTMLFI
jgi:hypothetical protein